LAGGYTEGAYLEQAELRRINIDSRGQANIELIRIDLSTDADTSIQLQSQDTIRINQIPNFSVNETVELTGEFLFPGTYTISKNETLSSLILRAGGFTESAYLMGTQYFSETARQSQLKQLEKISASMERRIESREQVGEANVELSAPSGDDSADSPLLGIDENLLGRVVVDIDGVIGGDAEADLVVGDGDSIFVPKFTNTIAVVGEVYEPGTFKLDKGLSVKDYLELAGGETTYALTKNTYVLRANGSVSYVRSGLWKRVASFDGGRSNAISPGDIIVVPTNLDYDKPLDRVASITSVLFQSFSSIAALLSITNN
jgi:polysaccharide export outer membrane protein